MMWPALSVSPCTRTTPASARTFPSSIWRHPFNGGEVDSDTSTDNSPDSSSGYKAIYSPAYADTFADRSAGSPKSVYSPTGITNGVHSPGMVSPGEDASPGFRAAFSSWRSREQRLMVGRCRSNPVCACTE
jgi:hypothetical protein